jgi:lipopolysaccharide biosynthesis regulator YciM
MFILIFDPEYTKAKVEVVKLGTLFHWIGRHEKALEIFQDVIKIGSQVYLKAKNELFKLGCWYNEYRRRETASEIFLQVLAVDSEYEKAKDELTSIGAYFS